MARKTVILVLLTCLTLAFWAGVTLAEKEPVVGHNVGNVQFSSPLSPSEAVY